MIPGIDTRRGVNLMIREHGENAALEAAPGNPETQYQLILGAKRRRRASSGNWYRVPQFIARQDIERLSGPPRFKPAHTQVLVLCCNMQPSAIVP
jgi:hypothetical protein